MIGATRAGVERDYRLWSKIWNIQGPPKLRHFLWRACKGSLPVYEVMLRRHIRESSLCPCYNEASESICYAIVDCVKPCNLWMSSPYSTLIQDAPRQSFEAFFLSLHEHASADELPLLCSSLWVCWMNRNKHVMENTNCDIIQLAAALIKMVTDYKEYAQKVFTIPMHRAPTADAWRPPGRGWIKVNFDAYVGVGCRRGLAIVCRDDQGIVLLTRTRLCRENRSVETLEAMAAMYGLTIVKRI